MFSTFGKLSIWFCLIGFYGISTIVGYLMPNPVQAYILNIYGYVNTSCGYHFKKTLR